MQYLQAIILGIVQGLTEFIPVSSSGHLIVMERLFNIKTGLVFDLALHLGTLIALVVVFAGDFWKLLRALIAGEKEGRLVWLIGLGTIPAVIAGTLAQPWVESYFRSTVLVGVNLIIVAIVMLAVDRLAVRKRDVNDLGFGQAVLIGLAQAAALIPGVSRSGSTITAGLALGLTGGAATRFSFLLAAPIIVGAITKVSFGSSGISEIAANPGVFAVGVVSAFVSGYMAIKFMLSFLNNHGLAPFAYYRIIVGVIILIMGATKWI